MNKEESQLKKEFNKVDIQRARNIISGNAGAKTQVLSGWEKNKRVYKEGDTWEQNGKEWTLKNGLKQTITKLDAIKKLAVLPLTCPSCQKSMKITELNKKMYAIHNVCFNCVLVLETKIKQSGKWDEYERGILNRNRNASLTDFESAVDQWAQDKDTFVTESGEIENWQGGDKKTMYSEIKASIDKLKTTDIY